MKPKKKRFTRLEAAVTKDYNNAYYAGYDSPCGSYKSRGLKERKTKLKYFESSSLCCNRTHATFYVMQLETGRGFYLNNVNCRNLLVFRSHRPISSVFLDTSDDGERKRKERVQC